MYMKCKVCSSENIVKNGKRKECQCYLCTDCRHQFVSEFGRHTEAEEKMAVSLYSAGLSFRTVAALFYVNASTVYRWIRGYELSHLEKPLQKGEIIVETDEMLRFVRSKKANGGFGKYIAAQLDALSFGK